MQKICWRGTKDSASVAADIIIQMNEISASSGQVTSSPGELRNHTDSVKSESDNISGVVELLQKSVKDIETMSEKKMGKL